MAENMNGAQTYVGRTNAAAANAKKNIAAVAAAGMKRNPSYAAQPGYTETAADAKTDRAEP